MTLRSTLERWLLGPASTFRNANRNWLYLGFIVLIVAVVAVRASFPT